VTWNALLVLACAFANRGKPQKTF